ncbi:hypothetical protein FXF51_31840 [Nonomuraea sp. PA05]|uniref:hypothetical protein n=1 Tax=Nonomuraea sp. PA05 TaxID=2604466 RepID=UPI0011D57BAC|nr:hypothetical protein [Nonomuraea sp. PA05]TYB60193.1 hypothetical protein FXF51_31840 [Nonomuraea sp. PA05]
MRSAPSLSDAMFAAARSGDLRVLWIIGEDVATTDPGADEVLAASAAACGTVTSRPEHTVTAVRLRLEESP